MPDPNLDAVNAVTLKVIWPRQITDNFFRAIPFFTMLRDKAIMPFDGGTLMQYPFLFNAELGGAYSPGSTFNIDKVDTIAATQFREKYYQTNITEFKEEIQVRNKGEAAVFRLLDARMKNAMMTMTTIIALDAWRHGQALGSDNRSININGISEALNDGSVPSWDGNIFTTYGNQARNGVIGTSLNSVPQWFGKSDGSTGKITYDQMEHMYQLASQGNISPDLGVTSKRGLTILKNALQVQQQFNQETDPRYGFEGIRLNKMLITKDDYCPSAFGANDPRLGNYLTSSFTNPLTSGTPAGGFPTTSTAANLTVGEILFYLNTDTWIYRVASDPEFQFGFTGFKPAQDNTRVSGQILVANNLECVAPRLNIHGYGFGF